MRLALEALAQEALHLGHDSVESLDAIRFGCPIGGNEINDADRPRRFRCPRGRSSRSGEQQTEEDSQDTASDVDAAHELSGDGCGPRRR